MEPNCSCHEETPGILFYLQWNKHTKSKYKRHSCIVNVPSICGVYCTSVHPREKGPASVAVTLWFFLSQFQGLRAEGAGTVQIGKLSKPNGVCDLWTLMIFYLILNVIIHCTLLLIPHLDWKTFDSFPNYTRNCGMVQLDVSSKQKKNIFLQGSCITDCLTRDIGSLPFKRASCCLLLSRHGTEVTEVLLQTQSRSSNLQTWSWVCKLLSPAGFTVLLHLVALFLVLTTFPDMNNGHLTS